MDDILKSGVCPKTGTLEKKTSSPLSDESKEFIDRSRSSATKKAYRADWDRFVEWTEEKKLSSLPAEGSTVANYISHLATIGRAPSTISRVLSSISQAHKTSDLPSPTGSPEVINVNKGIRRDKGTAQRRAKPLVLADLKRVCDKIRPSFLGKRDKALILVGWAAALRRSEIVALDIEDIDFVEQGMILTIRRSKTDQEGAGYKIGIPFASDKHYCPVLKTADWINVAEISSGPLFFAIGTPGKKWHAHIETPRRLAASMVNAVIKRRLKISGMNPAGYSGHSLRAGFVTSAAKEEIPEHRIKTQTRHRSTAILRSYIRDGAIFENHPLSILL
jgi:integrase